MNFESCVCILYPYPRGGVELDPGPCGPVDQTHTDHLTLPPSIDMNVGDLGLSAELSANLMPV